MSISTLISILLSAHADQLNPFSQKQALWTGVGSRAPEQRTTIRTSPTLAFSTAPLMPLPLIIPSCYLSHAGCAMLRRIGSAARYASSPAVPLHCALHAGLSCAARAGETMIRIHPPRPHHHQDSPTHLSLISCPERSSLTTARVLLCWRWPIATLNDECMVTGFR